MAAPSTSSRFSAAMDRTSQWVFSQDIPTDVVVLVGESKFPLHKFLLVAKSGYIRRKIVESDRPDLTHIDLTGLPGGEEAFEKAARFCYGVNFEISVHNIAPLRCAAEHLEMTNEYCPNNLAGRTEDFLANAALSSLPGAVAVLRSCEALLPLSDELGLVQRCVDAIGLKACVESNFPSRSPAEWWAGELAGLGPSSFQKVLVAMKSRSATPKTLATAVTIYAEKSLPGLVSRSGSGRPSPDTGGKRGLLESIVALLPGDRDAPLAVGFLCCLLRAAILLNCSAACRREVEKRVSAVLEQATVSDLLVVALDYHGERVTDVDSVRRIVVGFVEREMRGSGTLYGGGEAGSAAVQKVARTVDAFVGEIATDVGLSVSKFAGIASALPKSARRFDDDVYRAVDIYLKAHPELDEIEREKVCSVMDPLKLSYEARLHASQNKRLPLQIVLHALYYDQLNLRSDHGSDVGAETVRGQAAADSTLMRENDKLRSELTRMKMYMSDMQRSQGSGSKGGKKTTSFLSSVSKKLGKLISFRHASKDTSTIDDESFVDVTKPRRRRFSIS